MNMLEKIQLIMDEKGLSKADVSKGADVPYTTFDSMFKKGFEKTKLPTMKKLANFFDVSMEYLINDDITDKNYGKMFNNFTVSAIEIQLITLWRKLPRDEQMKILGRIESKAEDYMNGNLMSGDE
ncbi:helix-turn-helix transcriptional regulator [Dehalobacter sp. DCM]|uniref:helix-turn-helix domain-containing protein n=1 Tax=Dehalobacter sp. DCM TaxID=2907827 RepID=UPI0030813A0A|nr:helix-turn-helix transcriptional regulator [Dehalobacter sp. DCM]